MPVTATSCTHIRGIRAWLSGGSGALGLTFARCLIARGAAGVVLTDIRVPDDEGLMALENVHFHFVDVRSTSQIRDSLQRAKEQLGGLDLVVNNAGVVAENDMKATLAINLEAVITATESAVLVIGADGIIVNVSSAAGVFPAREAPLYTAAKSGVVGYSRSRASALFHKGIRLNALCPAWVNAGLGNEAAKAHGWEKLSEIVGIMDPEDVAEALMYIISTPSVIGQAVYVSKKTGVCFPLRGLRPTREAKL